MHSVSCGIPINPDLTGQIWRIFKQMIKTTQKASVGKHGCSLTICLLGVNSNIKELIYAKITC